MVSSVKIILPFAQTAIFYLWLIYWLLVKAQMNIPVTPGGVRLDYDPLLPVLFAVIELAVGIMAVFPKSTSWVFVLLIAISSARFVAGIPGLFMESPALKSMTLSTSFIGIISVAEIFVLADKGIRERYRVGVNKDFDL